MNGQSEICILAGGLATRLRPLTENLPKAMVDILGKPFLVHQLENLKKQGITRILLLLGYRAEQIQEYFGDGAAWGVKLDYCFDGPKPLGTGGAVMKALPFLNNPFFVMYGDSYLEGDYRGIKTRFLESVGYKGLMTVYANHGKYEGSNVIFENGKLIQYSKRNKDPKMQYIDWGLGILSKEAFADFDQRAVFDLAEVYETLAAQGLLLGHEVFNRFYEIGSFEGIDAFRARFASQ